MVKVNTTNEQENVDKGFKNNKDIEESKESKNVDYDQLLSSAGEFGRYQVFLILCTFPFYVFGPFTYFSQLFMTEVSPNHWCWIPELANLTTLERRNLAIPNDTDARFRYSQCTSYVANWSDVVSKGWRPDSTWEVQPCQHGWEFNTTEIPYPTISSELGWVCDKDNYQATSQSIYFVGSIVGGLFIGWIADRFGRIPAAVFSNMIGCVAGIASIFATSFTEFSIYRFFMGMSHDNCMMMVYLLVLEYVAPKYRAFIGNAPIAVFYTVGVTALPWIALACGNWKAISLATSIPMGLAIFTPFVIPESPRWLLSRGRVDDTVDKVLEIARVNKKEIPPSLVEQFKQTAYSQPEERGSILDLIKRPSIGAALLFMCVLYTCEVIALDASIRSIGQLEYDFFLSFTLVSLTELPSLLLLSIILDWTGRKWLTFVTLIINGCFNIMAAFVGNGLPSVLCATVARFMVNMACNTALQWAAEIFPTPVRGTGTSIIHICGYVGTVVSPFVAYLSNVEVWLPMVVAGAMAFLGAAASLGLPETARKEMPQTFDDAERLMKTSKCVELPCLKRKNDAK